MLPKKIIEHLTAALGRITRSAADGVRELGHTARTGSDKAVRGDHDIAQTLDGSDRSATLPRAGTARGRDLVDELDYRALRNRIPYNDLDYSDPRDHCLEAIARQQGFTGRPTVADTAAVDALVDAGGHQFFRGIRDPDQQAMRDNFTSGPYYAGVGKYGRGNGTYVTTSRDVALSVAKNRPEAVMRIALARDANLPQPNRFHLEHQAELDRTKAEVQRLRASDNPPAAELDYWTSRAAVLADPGRFLAAKGYDAGSTGGTLGGGDAYEYWLVINRSAAIVER